jgi:hypothetical protein
MENREQYSQNVHNVRQIKVYASKTTQFCTKKTKESTLFKTLIQFTSLSVQVFQSNK